MKFCINKKMVALLVVLAGFSNTALAGTSSGKVTNIYAHVSNSAYGNADGAILFAAGPHVNKPSCSIVGDEWSISLGTEHGKAMYSMLLSAAAMGKSVFVEGEGNCNGWSDRESPKYMRIDY